MSDERDRSKQATARSCAVCSMAFFEGEYILGVFWEEKPGLAVGWYGEACSWRTSMLFGSFFGEAVVSLVSGAWVCGFFIWKALLGHLTVLSLRLFEEACFVENRNTFAALCLNRSSSSRTSENPEGFCSSAKEGLKSPICFKPEDLYPRSFEDSRAKGIDTHRTLESANLVPVVASFVEWWQLSVSFCSRSSRCFLKLSCFCFAFRLACSTTDW